MNRLIQISALTLFSVLLLTSCQTSTPLSNTNSLPKNSNNSPTVSLNANTAPGKPANVNGNEEPHIMGNPAVVNCTQQGGTPQTKKNPSGTLYDVCVFEENRQCEIWALLNGQCPTGGLKITGYENDAQIYCIITGGTVKMDTKPATCELPTSLGSCRRLFRQRQRVRSTDSRQRSGRSWLYSLCRLHLVRSAQKMYPLLGETMSDVRPEINRTILYQRYIHPPLRQ